MKGRWRDLARHNGMRLVGPNCIGVVNTAVGMNATFSPYAPRPGRIAMQSQSGALGIGILERSNRIGVGVSSFVSVGNKPDVSGNDLLQYWEDDPRNARHPPVPGVLREPAQVQPHRPPGLAFVAGIAAAVRLPRSAPGGRGGAEDMLQRVVRLAAVTPQVAELDFNPVIVSPSGVKIVDARVKVIPAGPIPPQYLRRLNS